VLVQARLGPAEREPGLQSSARRCAPRRVMFAVEDIDAVVARVRAHGADLVGEVVQYEDTYRLAYIRGPEGIIVGLSEQIG
jgi:predicted enzyme related to lactoylglutathione lyase